MVMIEKGKGITKEERERKEKKKRRREKMKKVQKYHFMVDMCRMNI